jgi:hypothetical protein
MMRKLLISNVKLQILLLFCPPERWGYSEYVFRITCSKLGRCFQVVCGKPCCNLPAQGPHYIAKNRDDMSLIFFMPREDIERMIQESGVQIKLDMEEVRDGRRRE